MVKFVVEFMISAGMFIAPFLALKVAYDLTLVICAKLLTLPDEYDVVFARLRSRLFTWLPGSLFLTYFAMKGSMIAVDGWDSFYELRFYFILLGYVVGVFIGMGKMMGVQNHIISKRDYWPFWIP